MFKKLTALAFAAALAVGITAAPADAAAQVGLAVPGSAIAGYATPVIVVAKAAPFNFVNADAIAPHDIASVAPGSVRGRYLFASDVISASQAVAPVLGMENTTTGSTYEYFCTIHPATMKGTIVVV